VDRLAIPAGRRSRDRHASRADAGDQLLRAAGAALRHRARAHTGPAGHELGGRHEAHEGRHTPEEPRAADRGDETRSARAALAADRWRNVWLDRSLDESRETAGRRLGPSVAA